MKDCLKGTNSDFPSFRNGHVALIDPDHLLDSISSILQTDYKYTVKNYESENELKTYAASKGYKEDICFGISFSPVVNNEYSYKLLFNSSSFKYMEIPSSLKPNVLEYVFEMMDDYFIPWQKSGFLTLQNWIGIILLNLLLFIILLIDNSILTKLLPTSTVKIFPSVTSMPIESHGSDPLA